MTPLRICIQGLAALNDTEAVRIVYVAPTPRVRPEDLVFCLVSRQERNRSTMMTRVGYKYYGLITG